MEEKTIVTSEIAITLKVIGGKWKPLILEYLRTEGTKRIWLKSTEWQDNRLCIFCPDIFMRRALPDGLTPAPLPPTAAKRGSCKVCRKAVRQESRRGSFGLFRLSPSPLLLIPLYTVI